MEKVLTVFLGKTVSIANATWEGDRDHLKEIKLTRFPYGFLNWISDTLFGWIVGKRRDLNVTSLGNFPVDVKILDRPLYDFFSNKIVGKIRIVGADLQLNKNLNLMENVPGLLNNDRDEVENLKKQNELIEIKYYSLMEAITDNVDDVSLKKVLKSAGDWQEIRKKTYSFGDYLNQEKR